VANPSYKRHRFPPEIIAYAVWLYYWFALSFRDVEELLASKGVIVSYKAVRLWCGKFGAEFVESCDRIGNGLAGAGSSTKLLFGSTEPFITYGVPWIPTAWLWTFWCKQNEIAQLPSASSVICYVARVLCRTPWLRTGCAATRPHFRVCCPMSNTSVDIG
jgi:hypothetical protein